MFNKNYGKSTEAFEDGYIFKTVPLGSIAYPFSFALFWIVYYFYMKKHKEVFTEKDPKKRLKLLKARKFKYFNKLTKLIFDIKQFLFNLYVIDLTGACLYEIS